MEELIECICDYVRKPYTDYAVMLNGEWGSGKTYFWNHKLRSRLEAIKTIHGKNYKTIYMSLYGINSLEEISKKIFIETNPMINKTLKKFVDSREGNMIPEYVKTGLDMANLYGTTSFNSDRIDYSKLFAIDDKILCFDDLERANVDVIDILGYINNFVEHDGIKTILICNEKELATKFKNHNMEFKTMIASYILDKEGKLSTKEKMSSSQTSMETVQEKPLANLLEDKIADIFDRANDYERIKEKLIGETFEYVPEYSYILSGMIMKYSYNQALSDFYKMNTSTIIAAFRQSNTRNLRILKHALNDFEKIFNEVNKEYPYIEKSILKTMLTFTIAVSFEIKAGNISKEKLKSVKNNDDYISFIFTSQILNEHNQFYLREFDNRYFMNTTNKFKFFKFIEVYIRTRFFDEKIFKEDMYEAIKALDEKVDVSKMKYTALLNGDYWKLSDFEFDLLWKQVMEEVREGKVEFQEHVKLFAVFQYLISIHLIDVTIPDLKQSFIMGMQLSAMENLKKVSALANEEDGIEASIDFDIKNKEVGDIKREYLWIKKSAIQEYATLKAIELFKNLPENIAEFYNQILNEYKDLPVFSKYDMDHLYDKLLLLSNYDLYNMIQMFQVRYDGKPILLKEDAKNLLKLVDKIRENKILERKSIKGALLNNLALIIQELLKKENSYES